MHAFRSPQLYLTIIFVIYACPFSSRRRNSSFRWFYRLYRLLGIHTESAGGARCTVQAARGRGREIAYH